MEERIKEDILQYQELFKNPDNVVINDGNEELKDSTFSKYVAHKMYYLGFINNNYIIFSGEYQCGADNIILSSRYGKSKLILAKVLVAFIFSFIVYTINILVGLGIILISFGGGGWNLPIQIMVSITLVLSAKMKTPFSVLIVMICVLMGPLFLKLSETNGIWNYVFMILPSISAQPVFFFDATNYLSHP